MAAENEEESNNHDEDGEQADVRNHPTHHWPFAFVCGALAVINVPLGTLSLHYGVQKWFAIAFFAQIIAAIIWTHRYCRTARCPNCGVLLQRDKSAPRGAYLYPCDRCGIHWLSRIHTT